MVWNGAGSRPARAQNAAATSTLRAGGGRALGEWAARARAAAPASARGRAGAAGGLLFLPRVYRPPHLLLLAPSRPRLPPRRIPPSSTPPPVPPPDLNGTVHLTFAT